MRKVFRNVRYGLAGLLLYALPLFGQLQVGDSPKTNYVPPSGDSSNATVQAQASDGVRANMNCGANLGHSGSFGNFQSPSNHTLDLGGNCMLQGYYFNPTFLSFNVQPFYDRSQTDAGLQSLSHSNGVSANANIFSGSHFPGAISFNDTNNSIGQFGVPGLGGLTTNGGNRGFSIDWSALLPRLPTLSLTYSIGGGSSSVYGTTIESATANRTLNLRSNYSLAGFWLNGFYLRQAMDSSFPDFLASSTVEKTNSDINSYGFSASHRLPLSGQISVSGTRFSDSTDMPSTISTGTGDSAGATVTLRPVDKLSVFFGSNYTDNLAGVLQRELIGAGIVETPNVLGSSSRSLVENAGAYYTIFRNLSVQTMASHMEERFLGKTYSATQFSGAATYSYARPLFGSLSFSLGAADSATQDGNGGAGVVTNVNFARKVGRWELGANFSYSQNVQTLLVIYTTSYYNYGTSVRRRLGEYHSWAAAFSGSHSGLTQQSGSGSHSETLSTNFSGRRYAFAANYARSYGISVFTATGLAPTPTAVPIGIISPFELVSYQGRSLGFGASASPLRRLTLSANYTKGSSNTIARTIASVNGTEMLNTFLRYRARKLNLTAGFTRFKQRISATAAPPVVINSYFLGVSRWFTIF